MLSEYSLDLSHCKYAFVLMGNGVEGKEVMKRKQKLGRIKGEEECEGDENSFGNH